MSEGAPGRTPKTKPLTLRVVAKPVAFSGRETVTPLFVAVTGDEALEIQLVAKPASAPDDFIAPATLDMLGTVGEAPAGIATSVAPRTAATAHETTALLK